MVSWAFTLEKFCIEFVSIFRVPLVCYEFGDDILCNVIGLADIIFRYNFRFPEGVNDWSKTVDSHIYE